MVADVADDGGNATAEPKPALRRIVGFWGAMWLGLGSIIGTGVFVSLGIATGIVGTAVVVAVVLAACVATANGLSSAQLAAAHPVSGGTYEYGHKFVHPLVGYAAGWMFLVAKSASAATAALGFASYFSQVTGFADSVASRTVVALGMVAALTLVVAAGIRRSNLINFAIVSLTLFALALFVGFGIASWPGSIHLSMESIRTDLSSVPAVLEATALLFVGYAGYGRIATLGEEVRKPAQTIPRAIIGTLLITMVLYVSVAVVAVGVAGAPAFAGASDALGAPLELVAASFEASWVASVVAIGAITAMAGVVLNLLLGLSRVALAMARRRDLVAWFDAINASGSPTRSVWLVGAIVLGLVCIGDLKTTWSFSAFAVLIYYGITNLAALRLPKSARRFPRAIAVFGLLSCLGLAFFVETRIWLIGLAVLAIGFVPRWLARRSNG